MLKPKVSAGPLLQPALPSCKSSRRLQHLGTVKVRSTKALRERVRKLERTTGDHWFAHFGTVGDFEGAVSAGVANGTYDAEDMGVVLNSVKLWMRNL